MLQLALVMSSFCAFALHAVAGKETYKQIIPQKGRKESPSLAPDKKKKYIENFVSHLQASYRIQPDVYGLKKGWHLKKMAQQSTTDNIRDSRI
jgi:hypothetical protein